MMLQRTEKGVKGAPVYSCTDNPDFVLWRRPARSSTNAPPSWCISSRQSMEQDTDAAFAVVWSTATEPEQIKGIWKVFTTRLDPTKGRVPGGFIDVTELRLRATSKDE